MGGQTEGTYFLVVTYCFRIFFFAKMLPDVFVTSLLLPTRLE